MSLTGCPSYIIELKTRKSAVLVGPNHPYCYSLTPFHCRLQMPHAEDRLLGVRVRQIHPNGQPASAWTPWHSTCEGRFKDDGFSEYTAQVCMPT